MTQTPFEQEYYDILRGIELGIYETFVQNPALVDFQVDKVLDALARHYNAEQTGKRPPRVKFGKLENTLYAKLEQVTRMFLGREPDLPVETVITVDEMIACIKRIQRSVDQMKTQGRQGYLNFIATFFDTQ